MTSHNLLKLDFFSLHVLTVVYRHSSIRAAADELGLAQSSVSYTLDRLKQTFNDPLFVRVGRSIAPTKHCAALAPEAMRLVERFEHLAAPTEFNPETAQDHFNISCNFYERAIFMPPLLRRLRKIAPNVTLSMKTVEGYGLRQLEEGECDVVISPLEGVRSGVYSNLLFTEDYACFVCKKSELAKKPLTMEVYLQARHILTRPAPNWKPIFESVLEKQGFSIKKHLEVSGMAQTDLLMEGTDLLMTASIGFRRLFSDRVVAVKAPFEHKFPLYLSWASRTNTSPGHRWLRGEIKEIAKELNETKPRLNAPAPA